MKDIKSINNEITKLVHTLKELCEIYLEQDNNIFLQRDNKRYFMFAINIGNLATNIGYKLGQLD